MPHEISTIYVVLIPTQILYHYFVLKLTTTTPNTVFSQVNESVKSSKRTHFNFQGHNLT